MKWFEPKYCVCKKCGAHYDPVVGYEARWGDLCHTHREPVMKIDRRRDAVINWASANWEKLEAMVLEETNKTLATNHNNMAHANNNPYAEGSCMGGVGGFPYLFWGPNGPGQ